MNFWQAVLSGILQGITEFLPVSSSGHLAILHNFFGFKEPMLSFDILLHLATLFAVVIFFRKDIVDIFITKRKNIFLIILATLPAVICGFLFYDFIESIFSNIKFVAIALIVTGFWLFLAKIISRKAVKKELGIINAFLIGISQAIAILPGISRSGATISTGLILGLEKKEAVKFSFLLSIPAILGASVYQLYTLHFTCLRQGFGRQALYTLHNLDINLLLGMLVAFLSGYLAIKILLKAVLKDKLHIFGIYCVILGGLVLILV